MQKNDFGPRITREAPRVNRIISREAANRDRRCAEPPSACDNCTVHWQALCAHLSPTELFALNQIARRRRLRAGQRILSDQEQMESFAVIISGAVKLTKSLLDGRQQIVGLLFPADFVGRPFAERGSYHAEATTEVELCSFPSAAFERLVQQHPGIEHELFRQALEQLDMSQEWMLLLGRKTSLEKVASFLLAVARHVRPPGPEGAGELRMHFDMPLSRSDTADYLGLTIETVSRQFRILKSSGAIRVSGARSITILDPAKLEAAATLK
jgi:CRP/FNR family transcriptional regulator